MHPLSSSSSSDPSRVPSIPSQLDRQIQVVTFSSGDNPYYKAIYGIGQHLTASLLGQWVVRTAPVRCGRGYDWSYCPGGAISSHHEKKLISIHDTFFRLKDDLELTGKIKKKSAFDDNNWMTVERYNEFISSPSFSSQFVEIQHLRDMDCLDEEKCITHLGPADFSDIFMKRCSFVNEFLERLSELLDNHRAYSTSPCSALFKFSQSPKGLLFPKVSHHTELKNDEKQAFKNLGGMIAFLLDSKGYYPIKQFFDPQFFELLFDPLIYEPIHKVSYEKIFKRLGRKLGSEKRVREIEEILNAKIIPPQSATSSHEADLCLSPEIIEIYQTYGYEMTQVSLENDKKAILTEFITEILNIRKAIRLIATGISQTSLKQQLLNSGILRIVENQYDYLSHQLFKNTVIFEHPFDERDKPLLFKSIMMNEWFNEWRNKLGSVGMRNFLKRTTGSTEYTRMVTFKVTRYAEYPIELPLSGTVHLPMLFTKEDCIAYFEDLASLIASVKFEQLRSKSDSPPEPCLSSPISFV